MSTVGVQDSCKDAQLGLEADFLQVPCVKALTTSLHRYRSVSEGFKWVVRSLALVIKLVRQPLGTVQFKHVSSAIKPWKLLTSRNSPFPGGSLRKVWHRRLQSWAPTVDMSFKMGALGF